MDTNYSSTSKSTSSYINDLFGPNPSSSNGTSSSTTSSYLAELFASSMGPKKDGQASNVKHEIPGYGSKGENSKNSYYQQEPFEYEPHHLSNSIYYGTREILPPSTSNSESQLTLKKDSPLDEDPDSALRGNWWRGSMPTLASDAQFITSHASLSMC